jgi:hypothetical protein
MNWFHGVGYLLFAIPGLGEMVSPLWPASTPASTPIVAAPET